MVKEAYVSFEVAKLLKEKGFNEKCRGGYHCEFDDNDNSIVMLEEWMTQPYNNDFVDEGFLCSAPTHQMAMAWLREKKIFIRIIESFSGESFRFEVYCKEAKLSIEIDYYIDNHYENSYEEAVEEALKYVLTNLI